MKVRLKQLAEDATYDIIKEYIRGQIIDKITCKYANDEVLDKLVSEGFSRFMTSHKTYIEDKIKEFLNNALMGLVETIIRERVFKDYSVDEFNEKIVNPALKQVLSEYVINFADIIKIQETENPNVKFNL